MAIIATEHKVMVPIDANGRMHCLMCGDEMIEVEPNYWQCAFDARREDEVARLIGEYVHTHTDKEILHGL